LFYTLIALYVAAGIDNGSSISIRNGLVADDSNVQRLSLAPNRGEGDLAR